MQVVSIAGPQRIAVAYPESWRDTFERIVAVREPINRSALKRCIEVAGSARTVVFEDDYYDLDYRSEFSLLHSKEFRAPSSQSTRVHFFESRWDWDELANKAGDICAEARGADQREYLGYMTLRPLQHGVVGRTMLAPPASAWGIEDFGDEIRTAVDEVVTFFGHQITVTAVPFMEQDGHLLSCAHVTSWMCHYTSVLNSAVPRRPVAEFAVLTGVESATRRYPSSGLVTQDIIQLLEDVDMPAIAVTVDEMLARSRRRRAGRTNWLKPSSERRPNKHELLREELTSEVCRYLNSGLPCLLGIDDHQVMVCGYHRSGSHNERLVTDFICHDDQRGPYVLMAVPDHVRELADGTNEAEVRLSVMQRWRRRTRAIRNLPPQIEPLGEEDIDEAGDAAVDVSPPLRAWHQLILPTPRGVRTTGADAELAAGKAVLPLIDVVTSNITEVMSGLDLSVAEDRDARNTLSQVLLAAGGVRRAVERRQISLRTYATTGIGFKARLASRCSAEEGAVDVDDDFVRIVRAFPFPKYIWVTELMEREVRDRNRGEPPVIGEVIIDASTTPTEPEVLFVHLPGWIAYVPLGPANSEWEDGEQLAVDTPGSVSTELLLTSVTTRYHTGRPSLKYGRPRSVPGQSKGAISGTSFSLP